MTVASKKRKMILEVPASVVELRSSCSDSEAAVCPVGVDGRVSAEKKRRKTVGFLAPAMPPFLPPCHSCRQFWKAGDFNWDTSSTGGGMDRVRVHPKFLHSKATTHKWALGAFAELLDNSLDEVPNGATFVTVDVLDSKKDGSKMLLVEDDGGGMDPQKMRQCMSLGFSAKSKVPNTIGQYGNGFKTSSMRLGADVIVFSRCHGKKGKSPTQSIGLLSYTFLRSTGKEDIIVPMLDFERHGLELKKIMHSSAGDWNRNLETIVQWSPFFNEADLLCQFNSMSDHGTRIVIYNLWEDDQGLSELDFTTDSSDIQLRSFNRDEKNIQMANQFPNSRHFFTYKHSLRSYAAILYLKLPRDFRIILRGEAVRHHNIVNDMIRPQELTYKPQIFSEGVEKESNIAAIVGIGFVKDAVHHVDVQGFNVYHSNRLIKPFWRLWNATGSDGRGVIGVLEANFVEPTHNKQGFKRTTVLSRLEARLINMHKNYWSSHCHEIGYAPKRNKKAVNESLGNERRPRTSNEKGGKQPATDADRTPEYGHVPEKDGKTISTCQIGKSSQPCRRGSLPIPETPKKRLFEKDGLWTDSTCQIGKSFRPSRRGSMPMPEDVDEDGLLDISSGEEHQTQKKRSFGKDGLRTACLSNLQHTGPRPNGVAGRKLFRPVALPQSESDSYTGGASVKTIDSLIKENEEIKARLTRMEAKLQRRQEPC